jgi:hypothetical protein
MKKSILHLVLDKALSTKRPHDTQQTRDFTLWLWDNLPAHLRDDAMIDQAGNLHVDSRTDINQTTLFVAHVDTVHKTTGKNRIRKTRSHWYADGDVLGADDGAGVAMLMHLIHAGIPAYYIFTQGEEKGGIGAKHLTDDHAELLAQFDRAIAFDRRGIDSIITHQGWGRCCSDQFGSALCDAIGEIDFDLMHLNDDTGVYTDTAEFVDIIPECTNISIGYDKEHTQNESLNIIYFNRLAIACAGIRWDDLPVVRDPAIRESLAFDGFWQDSHEYDSNEFYNALLDARYGHHRPLVDLVSQYVHPDDPILMARHLNPYQVNLRTIDQMLDEIDSMPDTDIESHIYRLADDMYSHS